MKKVLICLVLLISLLGNIVLAYDDINTTNSTIILNGEIQSFSVPTITYNDRTMVPMRELFEKLNATVEWIDSEQKIIAKTKTKTIEMQIDNYWTLCNEIDILVDAPPILYNSRTMVPLRFVGEQLNLKVEWDGDSNTIKLDSLGETNVGTLKKEEKYGENIFVYHEYTGEIINNTPNGIGILTSTLTTLENKEDPAIFIYEGNIRNWEREGYSTYKTNAGTTGGSYYIDNKNNGWSYHIDKDGNYYSAIYDKGVIVNNTGYISYINKKEYSGEVLENLEYYFVPHGYGVMKYEDGGSFEGYWQYGNRHGEGKGYWPNGSLAYEGVFENDGMNGWGKDYREDGSLLYEGGHWNGVWTNDGKSYHTNGKVHYTGKWENYLPHGEGELYNESGGLIYEGGFEKGEYHGYGKSYWSDGTLEYDGEWSRNMKVGYATGTSRYKNGVLMYEGSYYDGNFNGLGKLYYENGNLKYEGEFRNGGWDGYGKLYKPDGTLDFDGRFTYNESTGESTWYRNR